jgi:hypothetical protein
MAKPKPPLVPDPPAEIHIVGLTKTAPNRYAIVTGTAANPLVDTVSQPLEYAAETMKVALLKMLETVP